MNNGICFNVDKKQAYLVLHVMSYQIISALRLYKKERLLAHQNECNTIDYRLNRIKNRPDFVAEPSAVSFSHEEVGEISELYKSLEPTFYLFDKYFHEYKFVFEWLREKVGNNSQLKTYKTCWCPGCPHAREFELQSNKKFYTDIPPAPEKIDATGIVRPPVGMFMSHDAIEKKWNDAVEEANGSEEKFDEFWMKDGFKDVLKQPFTEGLNAKKEVRYDWSGENGCIIDPDDTEEECGYHDADEMCFRCCSEEKRCNDVMCRTCNPWKPFEKETRLAYKELGRIFPDHDTDIKNIDWEKEYKKVRELLDSAK